MSHARGVGLFEQVSPALRLEAPVKQYTLFTHTPLYWLIINCIFLFPGVLVEKSTGGLEFSRRLTEFSIP